MREVDGKLRVAASDLSNFLACRYLTQLDAAVARAELKRPRYREIGRDALAERGEQHEENIRQRFRARGLNLEAIPLDFEHPEISARQTRDAIERSVDIIDQAVFLVGDRYGRPDFLIRADLLRPSAQGYEVVDAKLARSAKARAVLQIALYSEMLGALQGQAPEYMHLALGGHDDLVSLRVASYGAYQRQVDRMLGEFLTQEGQETWPDLYPDPVEHCAVCRWRWDCNRRRHDDDDLSLIAGITARQRRALKEAGISTRRAFAALATPPTFPRISATSLGRVHRQARLQVKGQDAGAMLHELLPPERDADESFVPNRGLLALPEPSSGDLFFDIEGARYYSEDDKEFGLQYLFGVVDSADRDPEGKARYHAFWAFDRTSEKRAFEELIDFIVGRLEKDPNLHVYHYNHYEPTAMDHLSEIHQTREEVVGRLMGRFTTRESEVDRLLTKRVFVDLYRVIRQGVLASVESYSIKRLEPLYGYDRAVTLDEANEQLIRFEAALDDGTADSEDEARMAVEGYNEDDCRSTLGLRDWLEELRLELADDVGEELPRLLPPDAEEEKDVTEIQRLRAALLEGVPTDDVEPTEEQSARKLMADLLEWHRRDDRPRWWRWFHLLTLDDEQLVDETDALGELDYIGIVGTDKKSNLHGFHFPPQEQPFEAGGTGFDRDGRNWSIWDVSDAGTLTLKRAMSSTDPMPTSLIQQTIISTPQHRARLRELGERIVALGNERWTHDPALDLLLKRPPHRNSDLPLRSPEESASDAGRRIAGELAGGYLAIQGPPGTGKTYTGAVQILELVKQGKKVGVTAMSHAVIANLLDEAQIQADAEGTHLRIGQKATDNVQHVSVGATEQGHVYGNNAEPLDDLKDDEVDLLGGTTWLWAREEFAQSVDVLLVDEASQMSLANVLAVAHSAPDMVLLGDPQQLGQPTQAAHPPGADASALTHILGEGLTIPSDQGLFIERTRRMHPDICSFTSEVFYEGRLRGIPGLERQAVLGTSPLEGSGLRTVPILHAGNSNASVEESGAVASLVGSVLAVRWCDSEGTERELTPDDVIVVTPFNAQVGEIEEELQRSGLGDVRVGTVDKFQGQQAAISIYSMASSSVEDAPRGMEFLFDLRRLNVATSRAKALAVIVASPDLVRVMCSTVRQMELANGLCSALERSSQVTALASVERFDGEHSWNSIRS